jgi:hypothetical protein
MNQTRDLLPCSTVPQPTASPHARIKLEPTEILGWCSSVSTARVLPIKLPDTRSLCYHVQKLALGHNRLLSNGHYRQFMQRQSNWVWSSPQTGAAFEGGKWGDGPRPRSWGGHALQAYEFVKLYSPVNWKCWYMFRLKSFFKLKFRSVVLGCLLYRNRHNQCLR